MPEPFAADPNRTALDLLLRGFQVSRMLRLVADLGLADRIAPEGHISVQELANNAGVQPQPLIRILRALAAFGIFAVTPAGEVAHTALSRLLRTDTPNTMHHAARFWAGAGSWAAWGALDVALAGGNPHQAAWNMGRFDYLRTHPEEARIFDRTMASFTDNRHAAIAASYDFSAAGLIADIGGGDGATLRHVLARSPASRGLLCDREDVVRAIPPDGLMDGRIETLGANFLDGVPGGADIYLLIRVLHNWSDKECLAILCNCRAAMAANAVLLIGEQILDPDPMLGPKISYLIDMQMMAMFGAARERTESEFRDLLADSGLVFRRVIPTGSLVSIVEVGPA